MASREVSMVNRTVDTNTALLPRQLSIRCAEVTMEMNASTASPVSFTRKGALRPDHDFLSFLVLLSSPPFFFCCRTASPPFFRLPPPRSVLCVAEEVCQYEGKATTSVQSWLQSWGRRGWRSLCMASYTAAEIHGIHTDT